MSRLVRPQPRFSPDGGRLLTLLDENAAQLWDVATGQPVGQPLRAARGIGRFDFSPDGRFVLTIGNGQAHVWNALTGELRFTSAARRGAPVNEAEFSPDSRLLAAGTDDGFCHFWDLETGQEVYQSLEHRTGVVVARGGSPRPGEHAFLRWPCRIHPADELDFRLCGGAVSLE